MALLVHVSTNALTAIDGKKLQYFYKSLYIAIYFPVFLQQHYSKYSLYKTIGILFPFWPEDIK